MSRNPSPSPDRSLRALDLRVPPFPRTLPRVLELLHEPDFTRPEALAEIVQHDPAATARLLKQINSAYYGLRRSITDVERAIRMMGTTTAAGSVVSLGMLRLDELADGPVDACFERLIRHCEATGFLASTLLEDLSAGGSAPDGSANAPGGAGFAEGLLHDFGKLVLFYNYPEKAAALYEEKRFQAHLQEADDRKLERLVFGCDHCTAGAYAALELNFPTTLVDVVRHHHAPSPEPDAASQRVLRAVRGANLVAKAMGEPLAGVAPSDETISWEACAAQPVWHHWQTEADRGSEDSASDLMDRLRAKREAVMLFTDFFVPPQDPEDVDPDPGEPLAA